MCGESNARTSIHVTNDANTNTYMGHEYYSDDDFNHEISLDCLITNSTYEVEYILTTTTPVTSLTPGGGILRHRADRIHHRDVVQLADSDLVCGDGDVHL